MIQLSSTEIVVGESYIFTGYADPTFAADPIFTTGEIVRILAMIVPRTPSRGFAACRLYDTKVQDTVFAMELQHVLPTPRKRFDPSKCITEPEYYI